MPAATRSRLVDGGASHASAARSLACARRRETSSGWDGGSTVAAEVTPTLSAPDGSAGPTTASVPSRTSAMNATAASSVGGRSARHARPSGSGSRSRCARVVRSVAKKAPSDAVAGARALEMDVRGVFEGRDGHRVVVARRDARDGRDHERVPAPKGTRRATAVVGEGALAKRPLFAGASSRTTRRGRAARPPRGPRPRRHSDAGPPSYAASAAPSPSARRRTRAERTQICNVRPRGLQRTSIRVPSLPRGGDDEFVQRSGTTKTSDACVPTRARVRLNVARDARPHSPRRAPGDPSTVTLSALTRGVGAVALTLTPRRPSRGLRRGVLLPDPDLGVGTPAAWRICTASSSARTRPAVPPARPSRRRRRRPRR